jgi:transposase
MARPISVEVRERVVAAHREGKGTYAQLSDLFQVGEASVSRWLRLERETGVLTPKSPPGRAPKLDAQGLVVLRELVDEDSDATLAELSQRLHERLGVKLVQSAVHKVLVKMGLSRKKKDLHATERDRDEVRLLRWLFQHEQREHLGTVADRLLFFDESGVHLAMTRQYARSPVGQRAHSAAPKNWGDSVSLSAGIGLRGVVAPLMVRGSMTGDVFHAYVEQSVLPVLRPGDLVLWDNLSVHKRASVRELIESVGATVVFLPPYSPDFNPIEMAWSKVKTVLRSLAARTWDHLVDAVRDALSAITLSDIANWFRHCGYVTQGHRKAL